MLPVTIIGGYLGAGKTTLVNHLLRHADGLRIAVLVNEFGALPIDADLIEAQDDQLVSIAGGCVCCSYGNDLIQALMDLGAMDPVPDHVLIEASGVALPGAIAASVSLIAGYHLEGVVLLADAETIRAQADDVYMGDTIQRQLADADLVLLNKSDLCTPDEMVALQDWIATAAPGAAAVPCAHGAVPRALVLQDFAPAPPAQAGGAHQSAAFDSAHVDLDGVYNADRLAQALAAPDLDLIRAKGFVPTEGGLKTLHVVGRRWSVAPAPAQARAGLVVIARKGGLDRDRLAGIIAASVLHSAL